jgi:cytochrome c
MYKSYHKKIVATTLLASVVFLGTACNASNDTKTVAKTEAKEKKPSVINGVPVVWPGMTREEIEPYVGSAKAQVSDTVKKKYDHNGKLVVDGGITYPIVNGKTGAYRVNEEAHKQSLYHGRKPTDNEQKAWDIDVMPDGTGLPEGEGSVEWGEEVYEEKCLSCHGDFGAGAGLYPRLTAGNADEMKKTLMYQRVDKDSDGPQRTFGSNWPHASTLWWYIKTAMPHQAPFSLTDDEVYALSAYILYVNEMSIDGVEVDEEYVLNREKFLKIVMPNVDGFEPKIDGPKGQDNARAYYNDPVNYGNGIRCMKDCFEGEPAVQRISFALTEFNPPLSNEKSLPPVTEEKAAHPGKKAYEASCAVCHATDAMGAPAVGDKAAWEATMKKGLDAVHANTINGVNGMPPRGGSTLSDDELKEVVDYMIEESK